jgi:hypothetical protein
VLALICYCYSFFAAHNLEISTTTKTTTKLKRKPKLPHSSQTQMNEHAKKYSPFLLILNYSIFFYFNQRKKNKCKHLYNNVFYFLSSIPHAIAKL